MCVDLLYVQVWHPHGRQHTHCFPHEGCFMWKDSNTATNTNGTMDKHNTVVTLPPLALMTGRAL